MAVLLKNHQNQCAPHLSTYRIPLRSDAGAVANDGIARKIGDRNNDNPNKMAVVAAVSPVLPPSDTPDALSTNVVVVVVPRTAPTVVATASAISAPLIFGRCPSSSSIPALVDTPIKCSDRIKHINK